MSFELVMSSNHLIFCHPLLLLPSIFPGIRVFSDGSALHIWWPKFWSFSFSISPSNEYSGLISFRIGGFDLPVVQGTLKSHLQHHNSKASVLWCLAFFMIQLSNLYMITGKTLPGSSDGKEFACSVEDPGLIPGLGRSSGEGNGHPFQYSSQENSMDSREPGRLQSMGLQRVGYN